MPADAMEILPGCALASAMNSGSVLSGTDGIHHQNAGAARHGRHRSEVAGIVEVEIVVERRIPGIGRRGEKERVAVRLRLRDRLRREIAAGAWTVLDDELLAQMFRQPLADQAGISVVDAAGRKAGQ